MASTVFMLNAAVIAFTLALVSTIFPTFADETPCTAEITSQCRKAKLNVKTIVIPSPERGSQKATNCSECEVEEGNHVTAVRLSEATGTAAPEAPTPGSSVYSNDSVTRATAPEDIRSDYRKYDGVGYYKQHTSQETWPEAERICEEEGAHLLIINSKGEEDLIREEMFWKVFAWVGVRYQQQGGYYETVLGEPLNSTGYVHWDTDEGRLPVDGECGAMWWITGEIRGVRCDAQRPFICELST